MRLLTWILGLPVAVVAIAFAVANRGDVDLDLWPLPYTVHLSLYLAVLGALVAGLLLGLFLGWAGSRNRSAARARKARALDQELTELRSRQQAAAKALPSPDSSN